MSKTKFRIAHSGMGGFLNPPNDLEHNYSVVEENIRGTELGSMSLRSALEDENVPDFIKIKIQQMLDENELEFTEEWEHSCYNYFRHCYSQNGINRNANDCVTDSTNTMSPYYHLAYLHIKSFFPDYEPNEILIENHGDKGDW